VGLAASIAAAVHYQKASVAASMASAYSAANNSKLGDSSIAEHFNELQHANKIASAQAVCEVCVLLLIVAAFLVVGSVRIRRLNFAMSALHTAGPALAAGMMLRFRSTGAAMALGRQMRKKVVVTTGFVFVALGSEHSCAITSIGGIKCWGYNIFCNFGKASPRSEIKSNSILR
jgi:alpha-tubulin suppressor-like RCC1 family protein